MNGGADDGSDGDSGVGGAGGGGNPYCQLNILNYYIAHSNTAQKLTSPNCIYICKLSNINIIIIYSTNVLSFLFHLICPKFWASTNNYWPTMPWVINSVVSSQVFYRT